MTASTHPTPKPGIMDISPYVGGKSKADGAARVIKLSSNENPWGPSPKAVAAYTAQAQELHRYPDGGHAQLREAIAETHGLPAAQLICGAGSDELIGMLVHAYAGAGDEVLYSQHGFLMYKIYALGCGATPVTAPEKNLTADVDALLSAVTARTKIMFLANPNNPTGTLLPFAEVKRLREKLAPHIILALDAAYAEYLDGNGYEDGCSLVRAGTNTVVLHTFSKIYGLPALRLGWAFAPAHMIDVLNRVRSPFNVNAPALAAGIAAVRDQQYVRDMREKNAVERTRVEDSLVQKGFAVVPSAANFLLVKFGAHMAAMNAFLSSRGLIVRDVASYGLADYLRISIGTTEENNLLIDAINDFAAAHAA
ncbi:MAG: histidinol-phosphate transaminase [Rickettsiales bacterium]